MKTRLFYQSRASLLLALLLLLVSCLPETQAQRRRPSRRATNPTRQRQSVPTPTPQADSNASEPSVVSTAGDENAPDEEETPRRATSRSTRRNANQEPVQEQDQLRRTINRLSSQVEKLTADLTQMKGDQRSLVDLERLTRAEQRAENLRAQLRDVSDKEFTLRERAAQLEEELQPDSIERRAAAYGSLRASELRDQIRRGIERERDRVRSQLELLNTSRVRLESAVASADMEVERIRQRLDAADREQNSNGTSTGGMGSTGGTTSATPTPTPTSTPAPNEPPL